VTHQHVLMVDSNPGQPTIAVGVYSLDSEFMASVGRYMQGGGLLQSVLRITVAQTGAPVGDDLPDVFGRYQVLEDAIRFLPHFPFEQGLSYQASFDPRPFGRPELSEVQTLEFSLPKTQDTLPTQVERIFPSSDYLPANLLRFYVCFSNSMQHGRVEAEVCVLGPDGKPAPDVLYRAPIELWDGSMKCLTILVDPGRLKRGLGPNRELGPPLKVGQEYTLAIGSGMTHLSGHRLRKPFYKRFRVTEAIREHIAVDGWEIAPPVTGSREPLVLAFPCPLDWALLSHTITIEPADERLIEGRTVIDQGETRWSFTPTLPWAAGLYRIRIASTLEDVCGNSVVAAFDRPLRTGSGLKCEVANRSISFELA
jgi:hypothetical protein